MFGEDFTSDPVSRVLGYVLRYFSHGHLAINVQLVSQVRCQRRARRQYLHDCQPASGHLCIIACVLVSMPREVTVTQAACT